MGNRPTGGGRNEYNPKAGKTDIDLVDPAATCSSMAAEMVRDVPLLLFSMDILSAGQCAVRNGSAFIPDEAVAGDGSTSMLIGGFVIFMIPQVVGSVAVFLELVAATIRQVWYI